MILHSSKNIPFLTPLIAKTISYKTYYNTKMLKNQMNLKYIIGYYNLSQHKYLKN